MGPGGKVVLVIEDLGLWIKTDKFPALDLLLASYMTLSN